MSLKKENESPPSRRGRVATHLLLDFSHPKSFHRDVALCRASDIVAIVSKRWKVSFNIFTVADIYLVSLSIFCPYVVKILRKRFNFTLEVVLTRRYIMVMRWIESGCTVNSSSAEVISCCALRTISQRDFIYERCEEKAGDASRAIFENSKEDQVINFLVKFLSVSLLYHEREQGRAFSITCLASVTQLPFLASTFRQCIDRSVKRIPVEFVSRRKIGKRAGKRGKENKKKAKTITSVNMFSRDAASTARIPSRGISSARFIRAVRYFYGNAGGRTCERDLFWKAAAIF